MKNAPTNKKNGLELMNDLQNSIFMAATKAAKPLKFSAGQMPSYSGIFSRSMIRLVSPKSPF
jgi:hypothetical protein